MKDNIKVYLIYRQNHFPHTHIFTKDKVLYVHILMMIINLTHDFVCALIIVYFYAAAASTLFTPFILCFDFASELPPKMFFATLHS